MNKKIYNVLAAAVMLTISGGTTQAASMYTLDGIEVDADRQYDKFGNVITEQSYYRTGGDVDVITSQTLEKQHFMQLGDALKSLPGVQVQTPGGYRGGEYGYTQTHSVVSINGDARVIVLIDGRRMDNTAGGPIASNSGSGSKAMVDINQITSMENIEKIEVIKGPGASIYGADATGGVINIITKKGAQKPQITVDLATGSWKRHNYGVTMSGSDDSGKLKYFLAARREVGGNSKYHDGITGKNYTWDNTAYNDTSLNGRFDYNFDEKHYLTFSFNHMAGDDQYPLTAPDWRYMDAENWQRIKDGYFVNDLYGDPKNPGYRNMWYMWAFTGAYSMYNKNNVDFTYNFNKDHGMDSFVRVYNQQERYQGSWGEEGYDCPTPGTEGFYEWAKDNYCDKNFKNWYNKLKNRGVQVQLGKNYGIHDVLTTWTYDKSYYYSTNTKKHTTSSVERKSVLGYLQDKIHLTDKWEITPSIRYSYYSDFAKDSGTGTQSTTQGSSTTITPSINTQYAFDDSSSMYLGYSKVYRPLRVGDYERKNGSINAQLDDEKGSVWTVGVRKNFNDKTTASIHYDYTNMSNAVARYSVWDKDVHDFSLKYVNAKEVKKSINFTVSQKFGEHWNLNLNYSHAKDEWKAKDGMTFDPDLAWTNGNVNSVINKLRPQNVYTASLNYDNDKLAVSLLGNYYTGLNKKAYTDNRFLVIDFSVNYDLTKNMSLYGTVTNLTNEAWQNTYTSYLGMGAWPQPGRAFMLGAKYKF